MYPDNLPEKLMTQTRVRVKYDCCGKESTLEWKSANKNWLKNKNQHICRDCWLKNDNPMLKQENIDKIKITNMERYGVICSMATPEIIEARSKLFKDPEFVAKRTQRRKETCLKKYGVENASQCEEIKKKQQETMLKNHGVTNPMKSKDILAKAQDTNLERYGHICSLHGKKEVE